MNTKSQKQIKNNKIVKILLFSWLIPTIIYLTIPTIIKGNLSFFNTIEISIFRGGFTVFLSFIIFHYLFNKVFVKRNLYIIVSYIFVFLINIFPFKSIAIYELGHFNQGFKNNFNLNLAFGMILLVYTISVHLFYLYFLKKEKIIFLTQQSIESQLNYQQLKNQISPHFLFNNINVLTSLIEENPKKAVLFSENLSNIYRYFLEQEKQDVVLVKDEIAFAKSYLSLLKDRFEIGLNFTITIDEKVEGKYIVSTILQQVLENVVKHNTINEDVIVAIKITSKENYLIVENNKNPKIIPEENSKKGIENIQKRIAFFTDEKVVIEDTAKTYKIQLPILEIL